MANIYSRYLSKKLKDQLTEIGEGDELYSLHDELQITKRMVQEAVQMFDAVCIQDKLAGQPTREAMQTLAQSAVKGALDHVRVMCESAAKVEALRKDKIPVANIGAITIQITKILMSNLKDQPELRDKIMKEVEEMRILDPDAPPRVTLSIL